MDFYVNNIMDILSRPLAHRCPDLGFLIDRCNIRELQEIFPTLVSSIFGAEGGTGWGLRTITRESNNADFDTLWTFFSTHGPMFRLCYRLLNETIKFEVPVEQLPRKMNQMLQSNRYSIFYVDMVQVDPFRRQVCSLSLNAFDYFMLHFAIHGTVPLHHSYTAARTVHYERLRTIYFCLAANFLCAFCPSIPGTAVLPTNIHGAVKMPSALPVPTLKPARSPKFIMTNSLSHYSPGTSSPPNSSPSSPTASSMEQSRAWRTESVLYIFIDTWLRRDTDDSRDIPSSEFISLVRVLVKQLHSFSNVASGESCTAMASLRKLAQPMMNAQMYPFLKKLIAHWPMDSSFSVVLELWLSYIQPWRYLMNKRPGIELQYSSSYETFVCDNLILYTQIFVQLFPRLQRLDYNSIRNVQMLSRLAKVFSQPQLMDDLWKIERSQFAQSNEWASFKSAQDGPFFAEEKYVRLFVDGLNIEVLELIHNAFEAKVNAKRKLFTLEAEAVAKRGTGFWLWWRSLLEMFDDQPSGHNVSMQEANRLVDLLDGFLNNFSKMFQIPLPIEEPGLFEPINNMTLPEEDSIFNYSMEHSGASDVSCISPQQMRQRASKIEYAGDPALMPIQSNECTFLVRFLHQLSCKLNIMFGRELNSYWRRQDIYGKVSRQLLAGPMIVHNFDKSQGITQLHAEHLGPRICLRHLASYATFATVLLSFIFGQIIFGVPSFGFLILLAFAGVWTLLKALICDKHISK